VGVISLDRLGQKRVVVTADDLGLSLRINSGIFESHRAGVVTAAALLVNAPATKDAIEVSREFPALQIGLHLGIVEGYSLVCKSSILDPDRYFGDERHCLHRNWQNFLKYYFTGRIKLSDLRDEFEAQIQCFLQYFPSIPFLNGTQHLHLLPGVNQIVLDLCEKYEIPWVRSPSRILREDFRFPKSLIAIPYRALGVAFARMALKRGIKTPDFFGGFVSGGCMNEKKLLRLFDHLPSGFTEIMIHPGFDDSQLRGNLPWAYRNFDWQGEMAAARSPNVMTFLKSSNILLSTFN